MNRFATAASVFAALLFLTTGASAQNAGSPTDAEVSNRLSYIQDSLDGGRKAANLWRYGWLAGYGAATVGQLAAHSTTDDEQQRQDMLVGSITTASGRAARSSFPLKRGVSQRG